MGHRAWPGPAGSASSGEASPPTDPCPARADSSAPPPAATSIACGCSMSMSPVSQEAAGAAESRKGAHCSSSAGSRFYAPEQLVFTAPRTANSRHRPGQPVEDLELAARKVRTRLHALRLGRVVSTALGLQRKILAAGRSKPSRADEDGQRPPATGPTVMRHGCQGDETGTRPGLGRAEPDHGVGRACAMGASHPRFYSGVGCFF